MYPGFCNLQNFYLGYSSSVVVPWQVLWSIILCLCRLIFSQRLKGSLCRFWCSFSAYLLYLLYPDFQIAADSGVPLGKLVVSSSQGDFLSLFKLPFPFSCFRKLLPVLSGNLGECYAYSMCFLSLADKSLFHVLFRI